MIAFLREPFGFAHSLFIFEVFALVLLSGLRLACRIRESKSFSSIIDDRRVLSDLMFCFFLFLLFYSQWLSEARPVASIGLAMPGSLVTRVLLIDVAPWLRRLMEPAICFYILSIMVAARDSNSSSAYRTYRSAVIVLVSTLVLESCILGSPHRFAMRATPSIVLLHYLLWQIVILLHAGAILSEVQASQCENPGKRRPVSDLFFPIAIPIVLLCLLVPREVPQHGLKIGAHYYSWFPENWRAGHIGEKLIPKILPEMGEYSSGSSKVFRQHTKWAAGAGIDFFIFDWWPERPDIGKRVYRNISDPKALNGLKFSLHYEALDLKLPGDPEIPIADDGVVFMTKKRAWRMKKHWEYLAKHYMKRAEYLRIDGKAVLYVYASRHLVGPLAKAIREAKEHVRETTGVELFIVGDEVFFNALVYTSGKGVLLLPDFVPAWDRLAGFDALTTYNPYDKTRKQHGGLKGVDSFLGDVETLYRRYREISSTLGIPFIPTVLPGYNDRGVRPDEDHYVIPRLVDSSQQRSFFSRSLKALAEPFIDHHYPLFTITSWNEWNEGTQIEPSSQSPASSLDSSESGVRFSASELHAGYGDRLLRELRLFKRGEQP